MRNLEAIALFDIAILTANDESTLYSLQDKAATYRNTLFPWQATTFDNFTANDYEKILKQNGMKVSHANK